MISIEKLKTLPRGLRLRKIAKELEEFERFCAQNVARDNVLPSSDETRERLAALLNLVAADLFSADPDGAPFYRFIQDIAADTPLWQDSGLIRAVNAARYAIYGELGQTKADWDFVDHSGRLNPAARQVFAGTALFLEDLRSPFNIGAIFRAAESFGIEKIFLSEHAADPRHPRALRSSMGCVNSVPWERAALPAGLPVFALETGGVSSREFPFPVQGVMLIGNEELGLSQAALEAAKKSAGVVSIPTFGAKGSLNVAQAAAIALYEWTQKRSQT
jgi:TrmH family RNA methyltransferase